MFQGWREGLQNHLAEFDSLASCPKKKLKKPVDKTLKKIYS